MLADEVMEGGTGAADRAVLLWFRVPGNPALPRGPGWLLQAMIDLSALGGFTLIWLCTLAVVGFLLLRRSWAAAVTLLTAVGGAAMLNTLLKLGFHRARPGVVPALARVSNASFPSGHAMIAAATWLTLAAMLARTQDSRAARGYVMALGVLLAVAIGVSRVYLGVHWPSDVLAGWLLGAGWAALFWAAARRAERR